MAKKTMNRNMRVIRQDRNHLLADDISEVTSIVKGAVEALPGGVKDTRFFNNRDNDVQKVMEAAGYKQKEAERAGVSYSRFKIAQADIPNKKKSGTYQPEYEKLFDYVQARLNLYNPGLGDFWRAKYPVVMANKGNTDHTAFTALRDLVGQYAPGTYKPNFRDATIANAQSIIDKQADKNTPLNLPSASTEKEIIESNNVKVLKPLVKPVMIPALLDAGYVPESNDTAVIADEFYTKIVAPATQSNYDSDHLDDAITNAILEFVATLQAKKLNGETLPKIYEKIATGTMKVQEKVERAVKRESGNALGNWIIEHPIETALIALAIFAILYKLIK